MCGFGAQHEARAKAGFEMRPCVKKEACVNVVIGAGQIRHMGWTSRYSGCIGLSPRIDREGI